MEWKEFFLNDNKNGKKTNLEFLKNNYNNLYNSIINHSDEEWFICLNFKEKIWYYINNIKNEKLCQVCNSKVKFKGTLKKGFSDYCSLTCANSNQKEIYLNKTIKTNLNKYGIEHFSKTDIFKQHTKKVKLDRYGDENFNNQEKCTNTKMIRYGDKNFNNVSKRNESVNIKLINNFELKTKNKVIHWEKGDIKCKCYKCDELFDIYHNLLNYRMNNGIDVCTKCNPISDSKSIKEKEVFEFIKSITCEKIVNSDRNLIKPLEIDILIDSLKLGIEFNGLFYHSDKFKSNIYHLNKLNLVNSLGYDLITIFEDEWLNKTEIVKSILINKINPKLNTKIFARNCEVREIKNKEMVKEFLINNHLQGFTNYKIAYGLFLNSELISMITMGSKRKAMGYKTINNPNEFELIRFTNKIGYNIIGGFSKLLTNFIRNNNVSTIITYSDKRYFNGKIYEQNGFILNHETKPNYFYIKNNSRYHRYKFRKSELVKKGYDVNKTEKNIMSELGYNRIYDCGNKKFTLTI